LKEKLVLPASLPPKEKRWWEVEFEIQAALMNRSFKTVSAASDWLAEWCSAMDIGNVVYLVDEAG
jgi:hypothetical protein